METYTMLREFADSWMLLFLTVVFLGVIVWAFRPGSRATHQEAASAIFRNEDRPARVAAGCEDRDAGRAEACGDCSCGCGRGATFKEAWK